MDPREQQPPTEEAFDALRRRIRETSEAAQRLAEDPVEPRAERPPPRGYEVPRRPSGTLPSADLADLVALVERTGAALAELARGLVPVELRGQFADALRELLVALRALIDFYLERLNSAPEEPVEVEEIPIS
jgi:hypothetical protein